MIIISVFSNFCYELDLFKTPVYFFVNSHQKSSTKLGVFLSFIIFTFIIYSLLGSNMYLRKNPKISKISPYFQKQNHLIGINKIIN